MGTPDLLGTYGTYQVFTNDQVLAKRELSAARVHTLAFSEGRGARTEGRSARSQLIGPPDPYRADQAPLTLPLAVTVNRERTAAVVDVGGQVALLQPGEWSPFVRVAFDPGVLAGEVHGIVRFALVSITPQVTLYASPINIDPVAPAMPISSPASLARQLGEDVGPFYTQGMPEETKAYEAGVLDTALFLRQARSIFDEERRLMNWGLSRFHGGLFFHYFSVVDQLSHMFYRSLEPDAPPEDQANADVLPQVYGWVDQALGEAVAKVGPNADVLVMSDHGFAPFHTKVNLNTWLQRQGFLALREHPKPGALGHIDWTPHPGVRAGPESGVHQPARARRGGNRLGGGQAARDRAPGTRARGLDRSRFGAQRRHARARRRGLRRPAGARARHHRRVRARLPQLGRVGAGTPRAAGAVPEPRSMERRPLHGPGVGSRRAALAPPDHRRGAVAGRSGADGADALRYTGARGHGRPRLRRRHIGAAAAVATALGVISGKEDSP